LLENGCYLVASDLPGKKLDDFTADLKQTAGDRVTGIPIDVTDEESITNGLESISLTWGGIDIVVVNAGIPLVSFLKDIALDDLQRLEKVNVEGTFLTLREIAKHFIAQGTGGDVIIVSTKNVPSPGAGFGAYSATKAACHQLGRIASLELAQYGIRVNMVAPDGVFSEGKYKSGLWAEVGPDRMRARGLDEKGLQEYYQNRNLLKAKITGRHVSNAVLFFATRQTPTTGITIPVDGGLPDATPR
jgi:NAD(P)-dependent dehydrogenase (short-subunit alcohol dehydrogenase family)